MRSVLAHVVGFFLAAETHSATAAATVPAASRAVVLGARRESPALAAAVALTLMAAVGAGSGVVAVWVPGGAEPPPRGPATPAGSRLAARLSRRELPAGARGRLAWLRLPAEPLAAGTAVHRAAAAIDAPLVTALVGPRPASLDELVVEHDLVVFAADPRTALARAALSRLENRCVSALACRPLGPGPGRALALAGLVAPRLDPPLHAVRAEHE